MAGDDDAPLPCRPGVGVKPDVLAGCRKRNREAEALERADTPLAQVTTRPGVVILVRCDDCGARAGFRVVGDFVPVRVRAAARKVGWAVIDVGTGSALCPNCKGEAP